MIMYAVVGCSECEALWIVEGRPETSQCPTCGHTRQHAKRKKFHTTADADEARQVRAQLLAERQGLADAFEGIDSFAEMESWIDDAGPDDETYLEGSGLDPDAVAAAGERAESGTSSRQSREQIVREALKELEHPGVTEVVAYAGERGVDAEYVERALAKLVRAGEASESGGVYRLV
jgi:hypothetical protein